KFPYPTAIAPTHSIAREGREDVAIGQHDVTGVEKRQDLSFVPICEVRAMDQRKSGRCKELSLLSLFRRFANNGRGVPLREEHFVAFQFQPSFEQVNLS